MFIVEYILIFLPVANCNIGTYLNEDTGIFLGVPNYKLITPVNFTQLHTVISVLNNTNQALRNHDIKKKIDIQNQECYFEDYGVSCWFEIPRFWILSEIRADIKGMKSKSPSTAQSRLSRTKPEGPGIFSDGGLFGEIFYGQIKDNLGMSSIIVYMVGAWSLINLLSCLSMMLKNCGKGFSRFNIMQRSPEYAMCWSKGIFANCLVPLLMIFFQYLNSPMTRI